MCDPIQSPPLLPLEPTTGDPLRFTFNSGRFAGLSFPARPLACPDPYEHVLPWDEPIEFKLGADRWLGLDQYCLRPGCNCSEAGIELFRHSGMSSQQRSPLPQAAFLFVDYQTGRIKIARSARRCPPLKPVIAALREAFPDLADRLRKRHLKLKRIARRALEASGTAVATPTPEPVPGPPVGRNDPCPCGSGKKFKKCCGST